MPAGQKTTEQASTTISQADTDTTTTATTLERNSHNHKAKSAINCNAHRISIGYRSQQRQQKRLACLALAWLNVCPWHSRNTAAMDDKTAASSKHHEYSFSTSTPARSCCFLQRSLLLLYMAGIQSDNVYKRNWVMTSNACRQR